MEIPAFLNSLLEEQYGKDVVEKIIQGYKCNRKVTLRVNTLKSNVEDIKLALDNANIKYTTVPWSNLALVIENATKKEIEELDIYKNGFVYLQSLSSMLPAIILDPKEKEDILDMASAPGGKTTQIAVITNNRAHITACELNKIRFERLKYNIEKQGTSSSVFVMKVDSRRLNDYFSFDKILLDSPCSGSGTINLNNENTKQIFTKESLLKCNKTQLELLKKAIKLLKPGKEMVYSTCSILACENEDIVNQVLNKNSCEIIPIDFLGKEKISCLPCKIEGTLLMAPDELFEGFFIAKIRKKG